MMLRFITHMWGIRSDPRDVAWIPLNNSIRKAARRRSILWGPRGSLHEALTRFIISERGEEEEEAESMLEDTRVVSQGCRKLTQDDKQGAEQPTDWHTHTSPPILERIMIHSWIDSSQWIKLPNCWFVWFSIISVTYDHIYNSLWIIISV